MAASARGTATRGAGSAGVGSGSSTSVEPKPSACDDAGRRGPRLGRADDRVLEAPPPAVACARHRRPILCLEAEPMPDEPALLARGPWRPDEVEVHWSDDHYDAAARARGGGRRRHRRAARPRLAQPRRPRRRGSSPRGARRQAHAAPAAHALGPAPGGGRRVAVGRGAVRHARGRRALAGRAPRAVAVVVGGALGARRRRRGRRRREPGRHAHARARRGVVGRPRARPLRGARAPPAPARDVHRPGLAARGRRRSRPTTSTTPTRGGRRRSTNGRPRPTSRCAAWPACWREPAPSTPSSGCRSPTRRST